MSLKDHMSRITSGIADVDGGEVKEGAKERRGSGSVPASATLLHFSEDAREMAAELDALKLAKGKSIRIRMDLCDDGPFHATPIDESRVERLMANLRENAQNAPALVRVSSGARYQIIAGRHRKEALLRLGEFEWDAVIREYDDDLAERLTFYDNLLAPTLPDYYKYLSFDSRRVRSGKNISQLAKESGLSEPHVSNLLAFGKLPGAALDIIAVSPHLFGSNFARQAAVLADEHEAEVVDAVRKVAAGMDQAKALASISGVRGVNAGGSHPTEFERGGARFAVLQRRKKHLSLRFESEEEASKAQEKIERLIRDYCKK